MPKKKLKKVSEIGFIPGIYNYCDRWCEKCDQQLHCMSYVMGKRLEEKGGFDFNRDSSGEDDSLWSRLKNVFESTYEVLHELAKERGVEVEDIYASENIDREFWGDDFENRAQGEKCNQQVDQADIVKICMIYENLADRCLERIFHFFDSKGSEGEPSPVDDAIETINWYLDLIQAKVRRALYGFYLHETSAKAEAEDYNGSAKVALIAVERSLNSWRLVKEVCTEFKRDIGHLLVVLEQLLNDIEIQFPHAREFKRPGFEQKA